MRLVCASIIYLFCAAAQKEMSVFDLPQRLACNPGMMLPLETVGDITAIISFAILFEEIGHYLITFPIQKRHEIAVIDSLELSVFTLRYYDVHSFTSLFLTPLIKALMSPLSHACQFYRLRP